MNTWIDSNGRARLVGARLCHAMGAPFLDLVACEDAASEAAYAEHGPQADREAADARVRAMDLWILDYRKRGGCGCALCAEHAAALN